MGFNITIDHATTANNSSRSGSSVTDEESSTGTGVQVPSPHSAVGSHERDEYSDSVEEGSWNHIYPDEIGPSDSASRPRTSNHNRPIVEVPVARPQVTRRQSSRRQIVHERIPHHPRPRARVTAPPTAPESVDSYEDWPPQAPAAYVRTGPPPSGRAYWVATQGQPQPGYAPSYSSAPGYSPYQTSGPPAGQQLVPFGSPTSYGFSPYQNSTGGTNPSYFPPGLHGHHGAPPMGTPMMPPHGMSPYSGQELIHHHPNAGYFQYPQGYAMPQPIAPPIAAPQLIPTYIYSSPPPPAAAPAPAQAPTPAPTPAPAPAPTPAPAAPSAQPTPPPPPPPPAPPAETPKDDEKFARLEKILMDERADREAREAAAKAAAEEAAAKQKIADDIAAASNAAAAAATEEAEKKTLEVLAKAKEEAEAAAAKAKEAADAAAAKAKEEADAAAAKAKEEAEAAAAAAAKAAAEAATPPPPPPPPEEKKKPIKFKDAVGRKFSFPFHLCNTWMGMEDLIRQAFLHVEVIGPHVAEGHYDLVGPQGDIILPQVWETVVEPDWTITMHMWPIPEPPPPEEPPAEAAEAVVVVPDAPPADAGAPPPPPDAPSAPDGETVLPTGGKPAKKKPLKKTGFSAWMAGGAKPKSKAKPTKKA